jgi:hypothetical protein
LARKRRRFCIECGSAISRHSKSGRCRSCYFDYKKRHPRQKRSASRDNCGTTYEDVDGQIRYADDELEGGEYTAASAWGSLRRCLKALRIAHLKEDEERIEFYTEIMHNLQRILNIEARDFEILANSNP